MSTHYPHVDALRLRYTLIDWINAGTVRASKIGNASKIDRSYLADWLEARELAACTSV